MPDIKVKDVAKGTVKAIDKSATAAQRMKNAYIRTKEKAEHSAAPQEGSPEEYAAGRVSSGLDSAQKAVREFDRQGRKGVKTTKENISKAKDYFEKRVRNTFYPRFFSNTFFAIIFNAVDPYYKAKEDNLSNAKMQ